MPRAHAGTYTVGGVTYPSQYAYRKALAAERELSVHAYRNVVRAERTFEKLGSRGHSAYSRVLDALSYMRRGMPATEAARKAGTTTKTLSKYGGDAIAREGRRIIARSEDSLIRHMRVPADSGVVDTYVHGSREASLVSRYWKAVQQYIETGDFSGIAALAGKKITVNGRKVTLPTDRQTVDRLILSGEADIPDIYLEAAA